MKTEKTSHFATFPQKLIEPCILAGTSEAGCCKACGKPWERVVERIKNSVANSALRRAQETAKTGRSDGKTDGPDGHVDTVLTVGWQPACSCNAGDPVPCTVLDPFSGAGTTVLVAEALGRRGIGVDIKGTYTEMARRRIERPHARVASPARSGAPTPLFAGLDDEP